jgi:hypothetical protein
MTLHGVFQKFETLGGREIKGKRVVDAIDMKTKDVLDVCGTSDDVADGAACALYGEQICGWKIRQNLNEYFCRKIKQGARHGDGDSTVIVIAPLSPRFGPGPQVVAVAGI